MALNIEMALFFYIVFILLGAIIDYIGYSEFENPEKPRKFIGISSVGEFFFRFFLSWPINAIITIFTSGGC